MLSQSKGKSADFHPLRIRSFFSGLFVPARNGDWQPKSADGTSLCALRADEPHMAGKTVSIRLQHLHILPQKPSAILPTGKMTEGPLFFSSSVFHRENVKQFRPDKAFKPFLFRLCTRHAAKQISQIFTLLHLSVCRHDNNRNTSNHMDCGTAGRVSPSPLVPTPVSGSVPGYFHRPTDGILWPAL